jgi:hypothetical protein
MTLRVNDTKNNDTRHKTLSLASDYADCLGVLLGVCNLYYNINWPNAICQIIISQIAIGQMLIICLIVIWSIIFRPIAIWPIAIRPIVICLIAIWVIVT